MARLTQHSLSEGWWFKDSEDDSVHAWMPACRVPSVVHQDLQVNKKLKDPFSGFNELDAKWVNEKSWKYLNVFRKPSVPQGSLITLVFDGLDTLATVTLDGNTILKSNNMFLAHRVDITKALEADGDHVLEITFDCAMMRARELYEQDRKHKWASFNGDPARMSLRKAQYHWGWDWGPILMTAGIWRDVRMEVYSARIEDLWTDMHLADDYKRATITAFADMSLSPPGPGSFKARFVLRLRGKEIGSAEDILTKGTAKVTFDIDNPSLWWPNGYGEPTLYELSVSLSNGDDELHQTTKKIGIRRAEVIQRPDKHGKSFFFRINGVDIFCGGVCWIPADSLLPNISLEQYRKWVELMVAGGLNMTRVWGGGIYEDDHFYDACDELGVMVWQDFMFACGNYPTWPWLLESIQKEATYNVRRLRHHPSIVIYVGNNEDYQVQEQSGLEYNYEDKDPENWLKTDFPARYIYEKLLPSVVCELSPSTFYHPGSPWGDGKITSDRTVGDLHQWNVWHGTQEKYQTFDKLGGRFNSEFGMESFPHIQTIESFIEKETDKHPQSLLLDFHNKAEGHERRIATYLAENVRMANDLETHIYLTQLIQSEAMTYAYRSWRRQWGDERRCGGALLWQMNDCWPGISWAVVDYFQRLKPAYYAVSRVLKPLAIGVQREHHDWSVAHAEPPKTSKYSVWVASSLRESVSGTVEVRFISVTTGNEIRERFLRKDISIACNGTTDIIVDDIIDHTMHPEQHVVAARLWVDDRIMARDVEWPQPFKYLDLSDRGLEIESSETAGQRRLAIRTRKPVKGLVFEQRDGVKVSDSYMDIIPGDEQNVVVTGLVGSLAYRFLGQTESLNTR